MTIREWNNIKEYEDFTLINNLPVGTKFLCGRSMISQKNKIEGIISYYEIIKEKGNVISFIVKTEKLEEF